MRAVASCTHGPITGKIIKELAKYESYGASSRQLSRSCPASEDWCGTSNAVTGGATERVFEVMGCKPLRCGRSRILLLYQKGTFTSTFGAVSPTTAVNDHSSVARARGGT